MNWQAVMDRLDPMTRKETFSSMARGNAAVDAMRIADPHWQPEFKYPYAIRHIALKHGHRMAVSAAINCSGFASVPQTRDMAEAYAAACAKLPAPIDYRGDMK